MLAPTAPWRNPLQWRNQPCLWHFKESLGDGVPRATKFTGKSSLLKAAVPKCKEGPRRSPLVQSPTLLALLRVSPIITLSELRRTTSEIVAWNCPSWANLGRTFLAMAISIPNSLEDVLAGLMQRVKSPTGFLEARKHLRCASLLGSNKNGKRTTGPVFVAATLPTWTQVKVKFDLLQSSLCYNHLSKERSPRLPLQAAYRENNENFLTEKSSTCNL